MRHNVGLWPEGREIEAAARELSPAIYPISIVDADFFILQRDLFALVSDFRAFDRQFGQCDPTIFRSMRYFATHFVEIHCAVSRFGLARTTNLARAEQRTHRGRGATSCSRAATQPTAGTHGRRAPSHDGHL